MYICIYIIIIMTTYTGTFIFHSSYNYGTTVNNLIGIPQSSGKGIINNTLGYFNISNCSLTQVSDNTYLTYKYTFYFEFNDGENSNSTDGFVIAPFGDITCIIENFGSIPFSRAGSHFTNFSGQILNDAGTPTILSDTSFSSSFSNSTCQNFGNNISEWDVSNVIDMSNMFNNTTYFNEDISGWNVTNVTSFTGMFSDATTFNQPIEVWTVQSTDDLSDMFLNATAMNTEYSGISTYGDTPDYTFFNQSSPYCLLAGSLVKTDQGLIKIEEIKKGYSIDGHKIIGISKEFYKRKNLVLIKKDLLGPNVPSQDTYITGSHQIMYNGELISCNKIIRRDKDCGFKIIKYDTEPTVYNVICEPYCMMKCNNILMETLEHCHKDKTFKLIYFK